MPAGRRGGHGRGAGDRSNRRDGSALAPALVSAGHRVIAVGRDVEGLQSLAARTIVADLAQVDQLARTIGKLATLDALVHCAGVSEVAAVADAQPATWQHTLRGPRMVTLPGVSG